MEIVSVLSRQINANNIVERWEKRYSNHLPKGPLAGKLTFANDILNKLKMLGPGPKPDKVSEVIGHDRWISVYCSVCNDSVDKVIHIESSYVNICKSCLQVSLNLLDEYK